MKILKYAIISLLMVFSILLSGCGTKDKQAKHVILISMDTTRADHLSCYGFNKKTTPNIDKFAEDSVLFEQGISPIALTLPAHSSMMTGTNPIYHGVHENLTYTLAPENITLAERFNTKEFKSGAIISAYVLDSQFGMNQGFDFYDGSFESPVDMGRATEEAERRGDDASRVACEWIEENKDNDFFLFLHYYDPHHPCLPPQPFATNFKDDLYSGEIAFMDFCIKQVLDKLKELKIYEDSLIIMVGDHGEGLGDHDEIQHGYYTYQSTIHVPMIVHFPGGKYNGKRVKKTVGLIDLAPTICRWTGMDPLDEYAGRDLTEYLEQESIDDRFLFSESLLPTRYGCSSLLSLVSGPWKYIQSSAPEMYNIGKDSGENNNLIESEAKRARIFQDQLKLVLTEEVRETASRTEGPIDEESRKKLESLGYISSGALVEDFEFDLTKDIPRNWLKVHQLDAKITGHLRAGRYGEMEQACIEMMNEKPLYPMSYYHLAYAQYYLKKYTQSITTAKDFLTRVQEKIDGTSEDETAIPSEGHMSAAHHVIGMSYYQLKQYDKAIEEFNRALEMAEASKIHEIYNNLGNAYKAQGDLDLAFANYSKALEVNPDYAQAHFNIGIVYTQKKEFQKSLQAYAKAHELKPNWKEAEQQYTITKETVARNSQIQSSIRQYESDLEKSPSNTKILDQLGGSYLFLDNQDKAIEYWEKSLSIKPDNADILNNLACVYAQQESSSFAPDKALEYAQKANQLKNHQNINFLDTLALVHAVRGDFDKAIETAEQALMLAKSSNQETAVDTLEKSIEQYQKQKLP